MGETRTAEARTSAESVSEAILQPLDETRVRRFHVRTILVAGMGFFTDAYDLFVIGLIAALFAFYQPFAIQGTLFNITLGGATAAVTGIGLISAAAIFGAAVGPFIFGRLGDRLGRKTIYGIEMLILVVGAIASSLAWSFASLVLFRFIVGVGIGGDYPMSATIMSEYANVRNRGRLVGTVFAMQGFGLLAGVVLGIGLLMAFPGSLDLVWRALLFAGAIPAAAVYLYRRRLPETPRFSLHVQGKARETARVVGTLTGSQPAVSRELAPRRLSYGQLLKNYWMIVVGTAVSWFLFDISFYGTGIYSATLLSSLSLAYAPHMTALQHLITAEQYNAIIALIFTIPGYWIAVATIDRLGRKTLQVLGFGVMALAFLVLGLVPGIIALGAPFVIIYGMTFLFGNIGPNTTTFVLPTELFPTDGRTTGHGIAAGSGKIGAAVSTLLFPTLILLWKAAGLMLFLAGVAAVGVLVTLLFLRETKQRTLEDASREWDAQRLAAAERSPAVASSLIGDD